MRDEIKKYFPQLRYKNRSLGTYALDSLEKYTAVSENTCESRKKNSLWENTWQSRKIHDSREKYMAV